MFFAKSRKTKVMLQDKLAAQVEKDVQKHKNETTKVVAQTKKIVNNFNKTFKENGFTIRIHAAAGGKRH